MIKKYHLLSPGPTPLPDDVLLEASKPIIHHRTPEFSAIYLETIQGLKVVFQTEEEVYILTSSGTGAMEAAVINVLSPGDKVITINGGKFGARWSHICRAYDLKVIEIACAWGESVSKEELRHALQRESGIKAVFSTLIETSTGVLFDIKGYAEIVSSTEALFVVDGISGLGAALCPMDDWNIDVLISASQKSFMAPPGLAYISFSQKARKQVERSRLPKFYFDAAAAKKSLDKGTSPWTPAITLIRQQKKALDLIRKITLPRLIRHHAILGGAVRAGVQALGLDILARNPGNALTAVKIPSGIDGVRFVRSMQENQLVIAGAQEPHRGEFFRVAHLGYMSGSEMLAVLSGIENTLSGMGYSCEPGKAVAAAAIKLKENGE